MNRKKLLSLFLAAALCLSSVAFAEDTELEVIADDVTEEILNVPIPKIVVPVTGGPSMSVIIESAVMNKQLKADGFDSSKEFVNRIMKNIQSKGE